MNYEAIENAIVQRLKPLEALGLKVNPLPENQNDYKVNVVQPRVHVGYYGSNFQDASRTADVVVQKETIGFIVSVQSRVLRGVHGVYTILGAVKKALLGYKPMGYGKMIAKTSELKDAFLQDGYWTYYIVFYTEGTAVEDYVDVAAMVDQILVENPQGNIISTP